MARMSKKDEAKRELAYRLGVPVADILTRAEVAAMMVPPRTPDWIIKNVDASPPFYSKGERYIALYPRAWVEEQKRDGRVMDNGSRIIGAQPWPSALPPPTTAQTALDFLNKLGVKVDPKSKDAAQSAEIEDYRTGVSEGIWK